MDIINEVITDSQMLYTKNDVVRLLEEHLEASYVNGKSKMARHIITECLPLLSKEDRAEIIKILKGE